MNRSLSKSFLLFSCIFFDPMIFTNQAFFASATLRPNLRGQRQKMRRDLYFGLAAHTPIRAHQNDGTSNCLRQKGPILSDVMQKCSHYTDRGPFSNPANRRYTYANFLTLTNLSMPHSVHTNCSLNNSPVICIARIIESNLRATATIAIFLRPFWPAITRS